jgi:proteasome lid subunit RPN8/RPN11
MLRIGKDHLAEISAHITEGYPHESCGLLIGSAAADRREVVEIFRADNLNRERARDRYELNPADFRRADQAARRNGSDIIGIYHSHPDHPCRPSEFDRERAWDGYSYLILSVTAAGRDQFKSWILIDGAFQEEEIDLVDPRTLTERKQSEVRKP